MVKKWQKKLDKLNYELSNKLYLIVKDITELKLSFYKVENIKGKDIYIE